MGLSSLAKIPVLLERATRETSDPTAEATNTSFARGAPEKPVLISRQGTTPKDACPPQAAEQGVLCAEVHTLGSTLKVEAGWTQGEVEGSCSAFLDMQHAHSMAC